MTKWFTSDLHFSHKNIVKFTNRSKDTTQEQHDEWLVQLWNSQVAKGDDVWHLGDFSFSYNYKDVRDLVKRLNGQKHFLKGNHDDRIVLNALQQEGLIVKWHDYKEIKIGDTTACLFHFPIGSWHKQGYGALHLHGHSHSSYKNGKGKILDVGLDSAWNVYGCHKFFSEQDVIEYMQSREKHISDHHADRSE